MAIFSYSPRINFKRLEIISISLKTHTCTKTFLKFVSSSKNIENGKNNAYFEMEIMTISLKTFT